MVGQSGQLGWAIAQTPVGANVSGVGMATRETSLLLRAAIRLAKFLGVLNAHGAYISTLGLMECH